MSIARATRKQLLAHLEAASASVGHHPPTTAALCKAMQSEGRAKLRELIEAIKQGPKSHAACIAELEQAGFTRDPAAHTQWVHWGRREYAKVAVDPNFSVEAYRVAYFGKW